MKPSKSNDSAADDLVFALSSLVKRIRTAAPELKEFSWTQTSVLTRLYNEGAMTVADLARAEGVKHQSMRIAIADLEEKGLIERKPHSTDGRQMNIVLTSKGKKMKKTTGEAKAGWFHQALQQLDPRDQETLFAAGDIIKRLVDL